MEYIESLNESGKPHRFSASRRQRSTFAGKCRDPSQTFAEPLQPRLHRFHLGEIDLFARIIDDMKELFSSVTLVADINIIILDHRDERPATAGERP